MTKFLSLLFWFEISPPSLSSSFNYLLIGFIFLFGLLTVLSGILKNKKGKSKNFYLEGWRKIQNFSIINLILGLILIFMSSQRIPFFSSRFWYLLWGLELLIWFYFLYEFFKKIPKKVINATKEEKYKKYLP
ncbi:hypothetical protein K8R61_03170 [bacterium]|nr:hypothetical protein [bacterium]